MFDIGAGEMLALAALALLVLGPEKLPGYAAEGARFVRQLRNLANDARAEVTRELGPELDGLDLRELNPRSLIRKHVLDDLDDDGQLRNLANDARADVTRELGPELDGLDLRELNPRSLIRKHLLDDLDDDDLDDRPASQSLQAPRNGSEVTSSLDAPFDPAATA